MAPLEHLLDAGRDGITVLRPEDGDRLQDHEVQGPLENIGPFFIWHSNTASYVSIGLSNGRAG